MFARRAPHVWREQTASRPARRDPLRVKFFVGELMAKPALSTGPPSV